MCKLVNFTDIFSCLVTASLLVLILISDLSDAKKYKSVKCESKV